MRSSLPAASGLSSPYGRNFLILKTDALHCSETPVPIYLSTWRITSEYLKFYQCGNFESVSLFFLSLSLSLSLEQLHALLRSGMHKVAPELPSSLHGLIFNGTRNLELRPSVFDSYISGLTVLALCRYLFH